MRNKFITNFITENLLNLLYIIYHIIYFYKFNYEKTKIRMHNL